LPKDKTKTDVKMIMTVRFTDGEINEKGLKVEPVAHESFWNEDVMSWTYDNKLHIISTPAAGESMIQTEMADAEKLNPEEPIDFEKVKVEVKKIDDRINREKEKELQDMLRNSAPPTPAPAGPQQPKKEPPAGAAPPSPPPAPPAPPAV